MSLTRDYITVPGQRFVCLSVIGPEAPQRHDKFGIKIRGCFETHDEASRHAKKLQQEDSTFDILVADMYQWLLIPPDMSKIDDVKYNDDKLQEIMDGYKQNQVLAARHFEERKRDMMATKSGEDMPYIKPGDEHSKYYTKPDEAPISHPAEVLERLQRSAQMLIWRNSSRRPTVSSPLRLRNAVSNARKSVALRRRLKKRRKSRKSRKSRKNRFQ